MVASTEQAAGTAGSERCAIAALQFRDGRPELKPGRRKVSTTCLFAGPRRGLNFRPSSSGRLGVPLKNSF